MVVLITKADNTANHLLFLILIIKRDINVATMKEIAMITKFNDTPPYEVI